MTSSATPIPSMATTPTLKTCYYYTSFKVGDVDIHIPPTMLNLSNQPSDREAPLSNSVKETLEDDHCHEDGAMDDTNVVSEGAMLGVPCQSLDDIDSCDQELQVKDSCLKEDFEGDDQCTKEEVLDDTVVSEGAMLGVVAESLDPTITWDVTFVEELGHELIVLSINDQQDVGSCDQEQLVQISCTKEDLVGDTSSNSATDEVSMESTSSVTRTTVTPDVDLTDSKNFENQEVQCHALESKGDSEILENQQVQNSCNKEDLMGDTSSKGVMDEVSIELTGLVIMTAAATTTTFDVNHTNGEIFESQEAQCRALESNTKVDVVGKDKEKGEEKNVPKEERTILLTFVRKRRKQRVGVSKDDLEKYMISKFGDNVIEEIHLKGDDQPHDVEVIMKNLSAMNSVLQNQREATLAIKGMPKILAQRKLVRNKSYFGF